MLSALINTIRGLRTSKKRPKAVNSSDQTRENKELLDTLAKFEGLSLETIKVAPGQFYDYFNKWKYEKKYARHAVEKALEHYVSLVLLNFEPGDVYIDIASASSPFHDVIKSSVDCTVFKQDLCYPPGVRGQVVGGDAAELPFPDNYFSKMTLHCSFEHFEGDADTRFIREAGRVLRPGGKLCILPLYLNTGYYIVTDPGVDSSGIKFDAGAEIREKLGFDNRFARHYNPVQLRKRVLDHMGGLSTKIYFLENEKEIDNSCYLKFILILEKK